MFRSTLLARELAAFDRSLVVPADRRATPLSSASWLISSSTTGMPAVRPFIAMPVPIVPAPMTAMRPDRARRRGVGHVGNARRRALGEKRVAQRARLRGRNKLEESLALEGEAFVERHRSRRPRRHRCTCAAQASASRSRAAFARAAGKNRAASGQSISMSRTRLRGRFSATTFRAKARAPARRSPSTIASKSRCRATSPRGDARAGHDHLQRRLDADHARQPLRAAGAGQDTQLHLRQARSRRRASRPDSGSPARARVRRPCRRRRSRRPPACRSPRPSGSPRQASARPIDFGVLNSRMSAPPENALPAPMSTMASQPPHRRSLVDACDDARARRMTEPVDGRIVERDDCHASAAIRIERSSPCLSHRATLPPPPRQRPSNLEPFLAHRVVVAQFAPPCPRTRCGPAPSRTADARSRARSSASARSAGSRRHGRRSSPATRARAPPPSARGLRSARPP